MSRILQSQFSHLALLATLAATLLLRGLGNNSLGYPDADRILMDGVFLRDTMTDMPFGNPWTYAQAYFAQYPALSIGYRPPFFPFVEGIFNLLFGVNMWSSRLALFGFVLVGLLCWYKMVRRMTGAPAAVGSAALWLSTPFVAQWGWYTMAELAVLSVVLCAIYYLVRWLEDGYPRDAVSLAFAIGIAAWTKQTAAFLVLTTLLVLVARGRFHWAIRQPTHYGAALLLVAIIVPLGVMTVVFGDQNIHQSLGDGSGKALSRLSLENWLVHLKTLVRVHLSPPALALVAIGLVISFYYNRKALWLPAIVIVSVYIFFSLMVGKNPRYPIFWIPFWMLIAALPLSVWGLNTARGRLYAGLVSLVVVFQGVMVFREEPLYATGYDVAAQEAIRVADDASVFIDAYHNGYFTYFARQADKARQSYILRGDKLLSSSSIVSSHWQEVHAETEDDILKIFDDLAVKAVVVESRNYTGLEIHAKLRRLLLDSTRFEHIRSVPIESNRTMSSAPGTPRFSDITLELYRYKQAHNEITGDIRLRLPVVGKTVVKEAEDKGEGQD
ncbi:ArnT family glycosyltransferase [Kordiimonas aestuarii]|uniref:ArnT family glycosyltransferase n=1 Tax=Kordiimonas aestuarii TaxID=1005925 RepID=UPI0021CFAF5A|nr:glycosyltransferase family 39 protein [Kordiimonas aestuarii]